MYTPSEKRYDTMLYRHVGKSGLRLPTVSLGLWQNFGRTGNFENMEAMIHTAFDLGITHFDLANNYGDPYNGSAEENFGKILRGMPGLRDEICVTTKAGYGMWPGPYGDRNGSRKYLTASLDQSLKRMGLEYVDIYYHHIFDPNTPLEETALALDNAVRQGKALYVGVSNYNAAQTAEIMQIFRELKTPFILNQPSYNMFDRHIETDGLDELCFENGVGIAVFCPLAQGLLTGKYLNGIPEDSRAANKSGLASRLDEKTLSKLRALNDIAKARAQTMPQFALSWVLRNKAVTTVLIGASRPEQIAENVKCLQNLTFTPQEEERIDAIINA